MSERIAKFIARSGVCSRRAAEELIAQKRVTVNGETIESPAFNVEGNEKILIDGEKLPAKESAACGFIINQPVWSLRIKTIRTARLFLTICPPACRALFRSAAST